MSVENRMRVGIERIDFRVRSNEKVVLMAFVADTSSYLRGTSGIVAVHPGISTIMNGGHRWKHS